MSMTSIVSDPGLGRPAVAFDHPALFYRTTDDYLTDTLEFVHNGLACGDAIAIAVTSARLQLLTGELGPAVDSLQLVDMTRAGRNPGRIIGGVLRAFADHHPDRAVRIVCEPVWPTRSPAEHSACAQHEALINQAFAGRSATIMCPYDAAALDRRTLHDATRTHPTIIERGRRRHSPAYAPEKVIAEHNRPLTAPADARTLTIRAGQLAWLRDQVVAHAANLGTSEDKQADWVLVLTELVTNSIEHGGGNATVRLFTEHGQLVGQVHDTGQFLDPLAGRKPAPPGQLRGRGLLIVNDLTDLVRLHTEPGSTTLEVRLRLV